MSTQLDSEGRPKDEWRNRRAMAWLSFLMLQGFGIKTLINGWELDSLNQEVTMYVIGANVLVVLGYMGLVTVKDTILKVGK